MQVVDHLPDADWRAFVDGHQQGNIFHTPEIFEVFGAARGYRPWLWAAVEGDRVLAMLLPVQITLMAGPMRYLTTRDVSFGGVLVEEGPAGRRGLSTLLREYDRRAPGAPLFTELRNVADQSRIQDVLEEHGYVYEGHLNYLLDLRRKKKTILQSFSKSARNRIRKGLRDDRLVVKEITDRRQLPLLYELLLKTYRTVRVPLADFSLFKAAFDVLRPRDMAYMSIAYLDGAPAAGQVSIIYKDVVYGWYNGVDRSINGSPNELLVWDVVCWGVDHGYGVFDFGGAGKPGEDYGVRDFKAKFNGKLVNYGRNTRVRAPVRLRISRMGYETGRLLLYGLGRMGLNLPIPFARPPDQDLALVAARQDSPAR